MVHFGLIRSRLVYSIHFNPLRSYSIDIDFVRSTSVLFGPHWSDMVHYSILCSLQSNLVLFGLLWFYSAHSIHFGPIWSYSVHFSPFWSYLVHFWPIKLIRSFSVNIGPIWSHYIMYNLVLFCPHWSYLFNSIQIGSLCSNSVHVGPVWSNSVHFDPLWSYSVHIGISSIYPNFRFHVSLRATNVCTWYKIPA